MREYSLRQQAPIRTPDPPRPPPSQAPTEEDLAARALERAWKRGGAYEGNGGSYSPVASPRSSGSASLDRHDEPNRPPKLPESWNSDRATEAIRHRSPQETLRGEPGGLGEEKILARLENAQPFCEPGPAGPLSIEQQLEAARRKMQSVYREMDRDAVPY